MRTGPWQVKSDSRRTILASPCVASWVLAVAVSLAIFALVGCVPVYYVAEYTEAADSGARGRTRAKPNVPLPKPALLAPQGPPDCGEAKIAEPKATFADPKRMANAMAGEQASAADVLPNGGAEPIDPNAALAMRIKLEYERECYRQAEERVRTRLQELQGSVKETIKSVNHAEKQGE